MVNGRRIAVFLSSAFLLCFSRGVEGNLFIHPHTYLKAPEMITVRGYPVEVHHVQTEDGYILEVHRIPYSPLRDHNHHHKGRGAPSREDPPWSLNGIKKPFHSQQRNSSFTENRSGYLIKKEPKVVFLQHCFTCSSDDFIMNDPDQALAFVLSNAGYDVWMGNVRGNPYSQAHVTLTTKDTKFWDFSWDKMARYDLPAMLSYVRSVTGVERLSYVGHSMGTTTFFVMMNYYPHMNSWVRVMVGMAPVAYMHNKHNPLRVYHPIINEIDKIFTRQGHLEFMRRSRNQATLFSAACSPRSFLRGICDFINQQFSGYTNEIVDKNYLPVIFAHTPCSTSFHIVTHFLQLINDRKFQAYDHGVSRNFREYGSPKPPSFNLSAVTVPVAAFYSEDDAIAAPPDVRQALSELPSLFFSHKVQFKGFNHMDFLWAENANHLIYRHILAIIEKFY